MDTADVAKLDAGELSGNSYSGPGPLQLLLSSSNRSDTECHNLGWAIASLVEKQSEICLPGSFSKLDAYLSFQGWHVVYGAMAYIPPLALLL
ncbi:hypothetical protein GOP47_0004770 [Adiantum capillus-veneris]|uniref:Uncharacterized protein n=1 Tax=Adiantum capillus-veneris TaxID=13818 RepID=A0A9D4V3W6_ADICA|nr:hypothetical protein GOP47_0004770 [Adiantum capillus-veneris]